METYHSNMARRWVLSLQQEGRILRQGKSEYKVKIFRYVTEKYIRFVHVADSGKQAEVYFADHDQ